MQTGAPLYNKDKISLTAKKKKALLTWKNLDGWTLNKQFFLFGLMQEIEKETMHQECFILTLSLCFSRLANGVIFPAEFCV